MACYGNLLAELDLTGNPLLPFDSLAADGEGYVSVFIGDVLDNDGIWYWHNYAVAEPASGSSFIGWYTESGELISDEAWFDVTDTGCTRLIARFGESGPEPGSGDVDGNETVSVSDAILTLRGAMSVAELTPAQIAAADVTGDGQVTVADAIRILRIAMGVA